MKLLRDDSNIKNILPVIAQKGYISAKSDNYGWFVNDKFALAFIIDKRLIFKRLIFMSSVVSLDGKEFSKDEERDFLEAAIDFIKNKNLAHFINKAHANVVFKSCPRGAECVPWGTFVVELENSKEELLKKFKSKVRQKIRKAIREGVEVKESSDINLVYEIIKDTMQRQGSIHYPSLSYLQNLAKNLPNSVKFFISYFKDEPQGCAVVLFDKKRAYVPYAGSIKVPKHIGAIYLMHFVAMLKMQELGVSEYDFVGTRLYDLEGSKFSGINRFKRGFNPKIEKGYAFKYIINPFFYRVFIVLTKLYLAAKGYKFSEPIYEIKRDLKSKKVKLWQE